MFYIIVLAILGAGVVTGLLFAFSNFVMSALAQLSDEHGMLAMQKINEKIINPIFLLFFLGTPILAGIIAIGCAMDLRANGSLMLLAGAIGYLVGPFGITMLFNVPLNNRLAKADACASSELWADYQIRWQRWNHLRTYIGVASIVLLAAGLGRISV